MASAPQHVALFRFSQLSKGLACYRVIIKRREISLTVESLLFMAY